MSNVSGPQYCLQCTFLFFAELEKKRVDLKRRYDAILLVKDEYKKLLGFHIRLLSSDDSGDIYVVTFHHARKVKFDGNAIPSRSVKLVQSSINKSWKCK